MKEITKKLIEDMDSYLIEVAELTGINSSDLADIDEDTLLTAIEKIQLRDESGDIVLERMREVDEMCRIIRGINRLFKLLLKK